MTSSDPTQITLLLQRMSDGDVEASEEFLPLVYEELRRMAANIVRREGSPKAPRTTSLVHEAWMRIQAGEGIAWENRKHFFRVAARAMRRVLVDHARARKSQKRGRGKTEEILDEQIAYWEERHIDVLAVHEALEKLEEKDKVLARIVELRFFAGLTIEETGAVLDMTRRQVDHAWAFARGWLMRELRTDAEPIEEA